MSTVRVEFFVSTYVLFTCGYDKTNLTKEGLTLVQFKHLRQSIKVSQGRVAGA